MPLSRPVIKDLVGWQHQILDHRRALLERLIAEFPDILKTNRSVVEQWRIKLSGIKRA